MVGKKNLKESVFYRGGAFYRVWLGIFFLKESVLVIRESGNSNFQTLLFPGVGSNESVIYSNINYLIT